MKSFDQYEFTGVLVPGVITIFSLSRLFPSKFGFVADNNISIGDLGLFVILAFTAGHLIQVIGNALELVFWTMNGGMPTDWVRDSQRSYLSTDQMPVLEERISTLFPRSTAKTISERTPSDWFGLTRQIYAMVQAAGRSQRIDVFNGNYGMFRGIAAAFLVCLVGALCSANVSLELEIFFTILFCVSLYGMRRFGIHYAQELFIQFVNLDSTLIAKGKS